MTGLTAQVVRADIERHTQGELLVFMANTNQSDRIVSADMLSRLNRRSVSVRVVGNFRYPAVLRDRTVLYIPEPPVTESCPARWAIFANDVISHLLATTADAAEEVPYDTLPTTAPTLNLNHHEQHILRILSTGSTDERAAAYFGISSRTFARRVASIMDALQARSRFQAGAKAAKYGLV